MKACVMALIASARRTGSLYERLEGSRIGDWLISVRWMGPFQRISCLQNLPSVSAELAAIAAVLIVRPLIPEERAEVRLLAGAAGWHAD